MKHKPRLVWGAGSWAIASPHSPDPEYWELYDLAIAWIKQEWIKSGA